MKQEETPQKQMAMFEIANVECRKIMTIKRTKCFSFQCKYSSLDAL